MLTPLFTPVGKVGSPHSLPESTFCSYLVLGGETDRGLFCSKSNIRPCLTVIFFLNVAWVAGWLDPPIISANLEEFFAYTAELWGLS